MHCEHVHYDLLDCIRDLKQLECTTLVSDSQRYLEASGDVYSGESLDDKVRALGTKEM